MGGFASPPWRYDLPSPESTTREKGLPLPERNVVAPAGTPRRQINENGPVASPNNSGTGAKIASKPAGVETETLLLAPGKGIFGPFFFSGGFLSPGLLAAQSEIRDSAGTVDVQCLLESPRSAPPFAIMRRRPMDTKPPIGLNL